jgi:hypothetical protein
MILYNSVKFKDRKSFDKNKTKKNVRAIFEDAGIIVFKDRVSVVPDKKKVSHTYSFGDLKKGIPTPTVYLRAKHYLEAIQFCRKNKLVIIQEMENVNWIIIELPEHISFEKFHAVILASNLFFMCSQHMHVDVSPLATNYTYNQIWQLPALQAQEAWDEIDLDPPPTNNIITVVDWACDTNHPDMVGQTFNNFNMITGTTNVLPFAQGGEVNFSNQTHGTGASSQIVAKNDGTYATGISPYHTKVSFVYIKLTPGNLIVGGVPYSSFMYGLYHCMQMGNCIGTSNSYVYYLNGDPSSPAPGNNAEQQFVYDALLYGRGGNPNLNTLGLGVLAFCANGNGPTGGSAVAPPNRQIFPAAYDGVVAVTATELNGGNYKKTYWADYGTITLCAAPGSSTPSSFPGNETGLFGGTSGATPLTAGVAALIHAARPEISANGIRDVIKNSCRKIYTYDYNAYPDLPGKSVEVGYGQVDAYSAVLYAKSGITDPGPGIEQNLRILLSGATLTAIDASYTLQYTLLLTKPVSTATNVVVTLFSSADTTYTAADPVITTIPVTIPANDFDYIGTHTFIVPSTLVGNIYFGANVTTIPDETITIDNTTFYGVFVIGPTPPVNLNLRVEIDTVSYDLLANNKVYIAYELENTGVTPITTFTLKKGFVGYEEREYRLEFNLETDQILNIIDEWSNIPPLNVLYNTPYKIEITSVNNLPLDDVTSDNISTGYVLADSPNP